jgi:hypothetical protein
MFAELKKVISVFELRVRNAFVKAEESVRALKVEVAGMDQEVLRPFDRLDSLIGKTRSSLVNEINKARREIEDFAPRG